MVTEESTEIVTSDLSLSRMERSEARLKVHAEQNRGHYKEHRIQGRLYNCMRDLYSDCKVNKEVRIPPKGDGSGGRYIDVAVEGIPEKSDIAIECKSTKKIGSSSGFNQALRYATEGYTSYLCSDIRGISQTMINKVLRTDLGLIVTCMNLSNLPEFGILVPACDIEERIPVIETKDLWSKYKYGISDSMDLDNTYRNRMEMSMGDVLPEES